MTLYPGSLQIPVMKYCSKASESQAEKAWSSGEYIMEPKLDGALYMLEKTDEGLLYLFSRSISKKTNELAEKLDNFPQIRSFGEQIPNGTILIGEVYIPGGKSNDVTRLTGCLPEKAIKRQFDKKNADIYLGPAHYYIFDCVRYAEEDITKKGTENRINYLYKLKPIILQIEQNISGPSFVELVKVYYDNFEKRLSDIFSAGGEGAVFKNRDAPYKIGKRSTVKEAFKYKEHLDSIDLICMELLDPVMEYTGKELSTWPYWVERGEATQDGNFDWFICEGNYYEDAQCNPHIFKPVTKPWFYGWKNVIKLGAYKDGKLIEVGRVASGLTDADRENMATHPENWLNKVIEVECMSVNKKEGTMRHPSFKRVRPDKSPEDCLYEEIFG